MKKLQIVYAQENPDILILAMDVPSWDTGIFIRVGRKMNLPIVIAASQTGPTEELNSVASNIWYLNLKLPWNYLLGKCYPQWIGSLNKKHFLLMPFSYILARELANTTMPQPGIESSSNANAVLIESEEYLSRGKRTGLESKNLFLTGYPFHDVLYSSLMSSEKLLGKLHEFHGLKNKKQIIVTSLLPDYNDRKKSDWEFSSYKEMVYFWISSLTKHIDFTTIVSLHPSQRMSDFSYVEQLGAKISRMPISELIPLSHIYVASLSSTITMAIACGKPVINYDFAHYKSTHYNSASGVLHVDKKQAFIATLDRILSDKTYYDTVVNQQKSNAKRWGLVDGKAGERIVSVLKNLVNNEGEKASENSYHRASN